MLLVFVGILGGFAFVFLTKLFWSESERVASRRPLVTLAIIALVAALVLLTATGRLHWIGAAVAGIAPFLRRFGLSLLRFAPLLGRLFAQRAASRGADQRGAGAGPRRPSASAGMSLSQAREILGLGAGAARKDIIAAHRRLMQRNHPDQGGSNFIAAQINDAKDVLLRNLKD